MSNSASLAPARPEPLASDPHDEHTPPTYGC